MNTPLISFLFIFLLCCGTTSADTLNRGNGAEPDSLNIHLAQGINSHNILLDLYEGLMTFDAHGEVVYGAAERHELNDDQQQWIFYLRADAQWSDGSPLLAQDFVKAWQQAIEPKTAAPYRHLFANLLQGEKLQVHAANPHELVIKLNHPDAGFLNKLVLPIFFPLPPHHKDVTVSNGAYYLQQWNIQEYISLKKNPHFHGAKEVAMDEVIYWVTENQNSELLRFRAGELDYTETIPDHQIDWLKQNLSEQLKIAPYYGTFFLGLNLNDQQLKNPFLRQALSHAIDRGILVDKVLKSGQKIATNIIPPRNPVIQDPLFDLTKAKDLLKKSGFKPDTDRVELLYNNSDNQKKVALAIAAMWRQNLGVKTQLKNQEWKMFVVTRKSSQKQVFRSGWIADYYDPLNFLELFLTDSHFNFYGFNNPNYNQTIMELYNQSDSGQSKQLIEKAQSILAQELPVIPIYHYVSRHLVNQQLTGYHSNLMDKHLSRYLKISPLD
ncbi:MAG: peptide ABC transporter substrate-binding protein [Marinicella sp.]|nr:peptide ABC transporter substrate-binding protein [Xanthomonadales bacterium]